MPSSGILRNAFQDVRNSAVLIDRLCCYEAQWSGLSWTEQRLLLFLIEGSLGSAYLIFWLSMQQWGGWKDQWPILSTRAALFWTTLVLTELRVLFTTGAVTIGGLIRGGRPSVECCSRHLESMVAMIVAVLGVPLCAVQFCNLFLALAGRHQEPQHAARLSLSCCTSALGVLAGYLSCSMLLVEDATQRESSPVQLRTVRFGKIQDRLAAPPDVCVICLESLVSRDMVAQLVCQHVFHEPCIQRWLARDARCPLRCDPQLPLKGILPSSNFEQSSSTAPQGARVSGQVFYAVPSLPGAVV